VTSCENATAYQNGVSTLQSASLKIHPRGRTKLLMTSEVRSSELEIKDVESAMHPYEVRRILESVVNGVRPA